MSKNNKKSKGGSVSLITGILIIGILAAFVWFAVKIALPNILPLIGSGGSVGISDEMPIDYRETVEKYAKEFDIPEEVIYAVIYAESRFDETAVSHAGAYGLMQITEDTFEWLGTHLKDGATPDQICDPDVNIRYGAYYLSYLYGRFGDWRTAYAAYNAGIGSVSTWLEENGGVLGDIPYSETAYYVDKVAAARVKYEKQLNNEQKEQ